MRSNFNGFVSGGVWVVYSRHKENISIKSASNATSTAEMDVLKKSFQMCHANMFTNIRLLQKPFLTFLLTKFTKSSEYVETMTPLFCT